MTYINKYIFPYNLSRNTWRHLGNCPFVTLTFYHQLKRIDHILLHMFYLNKLNAFQMNYPLPNLFVKN